MPCPHLDLVHFMNLYIEACFERDFYVECFKFVYLYKKKTHTGIYLRSRAIEQDSWFISHRSAAARAPLWYPAWEVEVQPLGTSSVAFPGSLISQLAAEPRGLKLTFCFGMLTSQSQLNLLRYHASPLSCSLKLIPT